MDTKTLLILAGVGGVAYYLYLESEKKKRPAAYQRGGPPSALAKQQRPLQAGYERDLVDSRGYYEEKLVLCAELSAQPPDKKYGRWTYGEGAKRSCEAAENLRKRMTQSYEEYLYSIASHVLSPFGGSMSASYSINKKIAQDELTRLGIDWQARKAAAEAAKKARKAAEFAALSPEEQTMAKMHMLASSISGY